MSEPNSSQPSDREAAVREWEKQTQAPLIGAAGGARKTGGMLIGAIAALALGLVWYAKNGGGADAKTQAGAELTIAERQPVPKLKNEPATDLAAGQVPAQASPTPATTSASPASSGAEADQLDAQRKEQERRMLEARLKSAIVPPNIAAQAATSSQQASDTVSPTPGEPSPLQATERGAQDPNSRFARAVSGGGVATSVASRIDHLEYKVLQGKLVEAVLEPSAVSDLPGTICATVQRDVYGAQGRKPLIPWGSRVCGVYSAELRKGQDRLFAVWNTVRRPDGVQVTLDSIGSDQLGTAGMGGTVDRHFAEIFGVSTLISIIGAGAATAGVSSSDQYNSSASYRQAVQQAGAQTSQQSLQPYLAIPPTVTVPPGERIRIYVNRDLDFTPVYREELEAAKADAVTLIQ
jgi:type IV secretion system protein VirB10